jgi:predicted N-formylglutamate amidohydrolase
VKATASAPTAMSPAATATMPAASDCRDVRDEAKRANRNARCQNAYRPLHGALSLIEVGSNAREPTHLNVTVVSAASFLDAEAKVPY